LCGEGTLIRPTVLPEKGIWKSELKRKGNFWQKKDLIKEASIFESLKCRECSYILFLKKSLGNIGATMTKKKEAALHT